MHINTSIVAAYPNDADLGAFIRQKAKEDIKPMTPAEVILMVCQGANLTPAGDIYENAIQDCNKRL